jgi:hypothetical protein
MIITVKRFDDVPRFKIIEGRRYSLATVCPTQNESQAEKSHFRTMGNLARQAKVVCGQDIQWAVYIC